MRSISYATLMCTKSLLGDPLTMLEPRQTPCTSAVNSINNVIRTHKKYWPNLTFQKSLPKENLLPKIKGSKTNRSQKRRGSTKTSETKIVMEHIESEKLDICLPINANTLSTVTDEEINKLQIEIENMKIKSTDTKSGKSCVNPHNKGTSGRREDDRNAGAGGSGSNLNASEIAGGNANLMQYLSENMQVRFEERKQRWKIC